MSKPENHLAGIAWMLATMFLFVSMDSFAKYLTVSFSPLQVVWARFFFHMLVLAAILRSSFIPAFKSEKPGLQLLRSALLVLTTCLFFSGLRTTALPTATGIMFLSPLFVTILAALLLKEQVGIRRVLGVLSGLVGALIIVFPAENLSSLSAANSVRPSFEIGHLFVILAALSNAFYQIMTRQLRAVDNATTTLVLSGVVGVIVMTVYLPSIWVMPSIKEWILMIFVGALGCISHFCLIRAFNNAPASVVVPFSYSALLWASLLGFVIFGSLPDNKTLVGSVIIIASGLYVFYREIALQKNESRTAD